MMKTYFSNRIDKCHLPPSSVESITHALLMFNQAKHVAFQTQVMEKRSGSSRLTQSIHLTVKDRFGLNDYYANSAVQEANGMLKAQNECQKLSIDKKDSQIQAVKKKIKSTKGRLTTLQKIKTSFIKGKPTFNQTSREQQRGRFFVVQFQNRTDLYYHAYSFEHTYLNLEIQKTKAKVGQLHFRLDRLQKQLASLALRTRSVVFGTKKLFQSQYTKECYQKDHTAWREKWQDARYSRMTISGRKDAKYGNFVFTYLPDKQELHFLTPSGVAVIIPQLLFPYGQEQVNQAITTQMQCKDKTKYGKPIAWSLEDHETYYIVKCMVDVPSNPIVNNSRTDGVLGIDLNVNHLAWANVNSKGQLVKSGEFSFDLQGKTSGQITKLIEAKAVAMVDVAVKLNKPIAMENLDTTLSKARHPYGNKKANRLMSLFAYKKFQQSIQNRAKKQGVAVFIVNPAYTSQIGKMKYMKRLGISIHQSASYVIARRAMGFQEKLPPVWHSLLPEKMIGLPHGAQWKWVSSRLSGVRTASFYRIDLTVCHKLSSWKALFPPRVLSPWEEKGL